MENQTAKQQNRKLFIFAFYLISLCTNMMMVVSLVLSEVAAMFPEASMSSVQFVYTMITLGSLVGTLVVGFISSKLSKKSILLLCLLITGVGGFVGFLLNSSLILLYVASFLIGLGSQPINSLFSAMLPLYFNPQERSSIMGVQTVVTQGGALIISLVGGILVAISWKSVYLLFLLYLPLMFVIQFFLIKDAPEVSEKGEKVKIISKGFVLLLVAAFCFGVGYINYLTNVSFIMADFGLGAKAASYGNVALTAGAVVGGLILGLTFKIFKVKTPACGMFLLALGAMLLFFAQNAVIVIIAGAIMGLGFGTYAPSSFATLPEFLPAIGVTKGIMIWSFVMSVGMFVSPYLTTSIATLLGASSGVRLLMGVLYLVIAFVCIIIAAAPKKDPAEGEA